MALRHRLDSSGVALALLHPRPAASGRASAGRLRRLYSGHVGDYVAWPTVGVTVLTARVGLQLTSS
ncbi:hypothetical protein EASAB2608_08291 [Streptomyces sp. EAS-AB2608]|nr:hypothetical protein EASAB2608_08291 [Streptomyces sp. EAS-AB2608]